MASIDFIHFTQCLFSEILIFLSPDFTLFLFLIGAFVDMVCHQYSLGSKLADTIFSNTSNKKEKPDGKTAHSKSTSR